MTSDPNIEPKQGASSAEHPAAPISHAAISAESISTDSLLAAYVDRLTPGSFTVEAKASLTSETKQYAIDLRNMAQIRQRAERHAEKALRQHVLDSAAILRSERKGTLGIFADWCKWVGFAFVGFAVQQFHNIQGQDPILHGSVNWLVADTIVAVALIAVGFAIDRPLGNIWNMLLRRRTRQRRRS